MLVGPEWARPIELIVGFGRYRGMDLREIPQSNFQYLTWLVGCDWCWVELRDAALAEIRRRLRQQWLAAVEARKKPSTPDGLHQTPRRPANGNGHESEPRRRETQPRLI